MLQFICSFHGRRGTSRDEAPRPRRYSAGRNLWFPSSATFTNVKSMTETRPREYSAGKNPFSRSLLLQQTSRYSPAPSTEVKVLTETRRLEVTRQEWTLSSVPRLNLQISCESPHPLRSWTSKHSPRRWRLNIYSTGVVVLTNPS